MPNNSRRVDYYSIRNLRWQPPIHFYTFITETCRYQLPKLLNDLNSNDITSEVINNINNVSLHGFKRIVKTSALMKYLFTGSIPHLCNVLTNNGLHRMNEVVIAIMLLNILIVKL